MNLKSEKQTKRVLVSLENKREYVLRNEKIKDTNLIKVARYFDDLLDIIENVYDDTILNKKLRTNYLRDRLVGIETLSKKLEESLDE